MATLPSYYDVVLFGALGDLSLRKLLPALYRLENAQLLHPKTKIIGCSREKMTTSAYIDFIKNALETAFKEPLETSLWQRFINKITYCSMDFLQSRHYTENLSPCLSKEEHPLIAYLAIPPALYTQVGIGLSELHQFNHASRIVLEKPIGENYQSAKEINALMGRFFKEEQIYRMDHYLGKETVLNLLVLRFANPLFASQWNNQYIESVHITLAEDIGVESRWDYYDRYGQVNDMLQNHILQLLSLIAMEEPLSLSAEHIKQAKLKILQCLRPINQATVNNEAIRAQYIQPHSAPQPMRGYREEAGANPHSTTETFVAIKTFIDNPRWSGVPFYLTTGKRLAQRKSDIIINFKSPHQHLFSSGQEANAFNRLIIRLQPNEGITLHLITKKPNVNNSIELQNNRLHYRADGPANLLAMTDAYERLLLEIMRGNQALFVSKEEIEHAWIWVDNLKKAWATTQSPLHYYPCGSEGPEEANCLFAIPN